jgi:hypothetical protein
MKNVFVFIVACAGFLLFSCGSDLYQVIDHTKRLPTEPEYTNIKYLEISGFYDLIPRGLTGEVVVKYSNTGSTGEIQTETYIEDTDTVDSVHKFPSGIDIYSIEAAGFPYSDVSGHLFSEDYLLIVVDKYFYSDDEPRKGLCDIRHIVVTEAAIYFAKQYDAEATVYCALAEEGVRSEEKTLVAFEEAGTYEYLAGIAIFDIGKWAKQIKIDSKTKTLTL